MDKKKENDVIYPEVYEVSDKVKIERRNAVMENALIEARYNLTVEEQRLVLCTIAMLDNVETASSGFPMLRIPVKLIIEATGIHEKNYNQIKNALQRLMGRVITIEDEDGFELYQWFAKAKYKQGEGFIEVQFHPDLKPYLLELKKRFTKIPLKQILQLRSKYAIRLYELLKRYEDTGFRTDYIPELREKLGVEKGEYERFFDFERRVLKPAVKEINEKTDLEVSYQKKKTGRKITHIEFEIKPKKKDTTKTKKTTSENIDIQRQKNQPDLWDTTLVILENLYKANPDDIDILRQHIFAVYKTDTQPKIMVLCTKVATDKGKKTLLKIINKYYKQMQKIVNTETNSNYEVKICKQFLEEGVEF
jgi:plasmid replication initiation protein